MPLNVRDDLNEAVTNFLKNSTSKELIQINVNEFQEVNFYQSVLTRFL